MINFNKKNNLFISWSETNTVFKSATSAVKTHLFVVNVQQSIHFAMIDG